MRARQALISIPERSLSGVCLCVTWEHGFLNFNAFRGSPTAHGYVVRKC